MIVLAAVVVVLVGALRSAPNTYSTPAAFDGPGIQTKPGSPVCQATAIPPRAAFDRIATAFTPTGTPAPVTVVVRNDAGRLATGTVTPRDSTLATVRLDRTVRAGQLVDVCFRLARGSDPVGLYSTYAARNLPPATQDDEPTSVRLAMYFQRGHGTRAEQLPAVVDRVTLFRARWLAPWMVWVLAAGLLVGLPLLVAFALRRSDPT